MYLPDIELHQAVTLEQAGEALTRYAPDARLLAGGTDLLVDLKTSRAGFDHLVSISRIEALRGATETEDALRVGALTTITQLNRSPLVRERFAPLRDATSRMAGPQIRNVATVGGNLAAAVPCADLPPILTAMNASVVVWSVGGEREVSLDDFFVGPRQTVLHENEVLTTIVVPHPPPRFGAAYERFQLRAGNAIAVASVAASLLLNEDDTVREARIVLGAVAPVPKLVRSAGDAIVGKPPGNDVLQAAANAAMAEAEPIADIRGSAEFRRELIGVLTRRALAAALQRAQEAR